MSSPRGNYSTDRQYFRDDLPPLDELKEKTETIRRKIWIIHTAHVSRKSDFVLDKTDESHFLHTQLNVQEGCIIRQYKDHC
jgi:hypothetical protein